MNSLKFQLTQFTIERFALAVKQDRVPDQKAIVKNIQEYANQLQCDHLVQEQKVLIFALCQVSKPILDFFENHFIESVEENQIHIPEVNMMVFQNTITTKIIEFIQQIVQNDELSEIVVQSRKYIEQLTFELSDQICQILEETRNYILMHIKEFNDRCIQSFIINKYVMYALFLELTHSCHRTVQDLLEYSIFHYADPDISEKFTKQAICYYDLFIMKNKKIIPPKKCAIINNAHQKVIDVLDRVNQLITNKTKPIFVYLVQQYVKEQRNGMYIECEDPQFKFIIFYHKDAFKVVYAPLISQRWTFEKTFVIEPPNRELHFKKDRKSGWTIYPVKFNSVKDLQESDWAIERLASIMRQKPKPLQQNLEKFEIDTMLGFFLANFGRNINLYKFGENAVVNGCMQHLILQIPSIEEFLKVGGFGNNALATHESIQAPERKIAPVQRVVIQTGTSLGSAVSGAIIGQVLIPIPMIGTVVGGLIGGYLGNKQVSEYIRKRNNKKAANICQKLEEVQLPNGSWEYSKRVYEMLSIPQKLIVESIPKHLKEEYNKELKWFNQIVFVFLCVYYSGMEMNQEERWPDSLENCQKWLIMEQVKLQLSLENLKSIIEVILKNI